MKVYIVFEQWSATPDSAGHEGMEVRAVFDTPEKADDYIHNNEPDDNSWYRLHWDEYEVE
jgi:hypothetical protein